MIFDVSCNTTKFLLLVARSLSPLKESIFLYHPTPPPPSSLVAGPFTPFPLLPLLVGPASKNSYFFP